MTDRQPVVAVPLRAAQLHIDLPPDELATALAAIEGTAPDDLSCRLAVAMAEEGFAVEASNRDEQWDAPYAEAARIVAKLGLSRAALAVEAVRPETDIDEERLARALHESDAAGCSSVDRPGEHTVEPHSFDFEDAKRLAAAYRATPTERPE